MSRPQAKTGAPSDRPAPSATGRATASEAWWRGLAWLTVLALTAIVTAWSIVEALERYQLLRSGWSWDLAYYNQWFWALTQGDGMLTVRPLAAFAEEGPSIWKTNYLAPIRLLIAPIYAVWPDPRTLLVVQNVVFWWCLPAAFGLVLAETGSIALGLSAVALVLATPLLGPLMANDFRELQLALPFAIWAFQGVRSRSVALSVLGVAGLLACRQEFALLVASLSILPPRQPGSIVRRYRWTKTLLGVGFGWFFLYLGYLYLAVGRFSPSQYLGQFGGPGPGLLEALATMLGILILGMGVWSFLMFLAPRAALLSLPWIWGLASGQWSMPMLETVSWHHVRYTAPMVAVVLAVGLIGYSRLGIIARRFRSGGWAVAGAWALSLLLMLSARAIVIERFQRAPLPVSQSEAAELWDWFQQIGPEEGVLAHYDLTAPLSSRRTLYSYVLMSNQPKGYPGQLPETIHWIFTKRGDLPKPILESQGFREVYQGEAFQVFHRVAATQPVGSLIFSNSARTRSVPILSKRGERASCPSSGSSSICMGGGFHPGRLFV